MPVPIGENLSPDVDLRLAHSFKNFLWKTWHSLGFLDPTDLQYDIADFLHHGGRKKVIMGFRGVAKSYITVPYGMWNLYRDPQVKILTTSATGGFAADNANFAFAMLENFDWLAFLRPRPDQRQAASAFDVAGAVPAKDTSFAAVGMFGQITGRRADLIVADDAETPNTSSTEGARVALRRAIEEFGAVLKPKGEITYLGTAQHEETIYLELEQKGYALRMWPAIYPTEQEMKRYGHRLSPKLVKDLEKNPALATTSTEPTRFDEDTLAEKEIDFGKTEFDRQFRLFLDAGLADSKPLKLRDIPVLDLSPGQGVPASIIWSTMKDYRIDDIEVDALTGDKLFAPAEARDYGEPEGVFCKVDPSGEGDDETTWTISAQRYGNVFALWQGASREGHAEEVLKQIAADCKLWGVQEIEVESNFGQGMFSTLLQPYLREIEHPCTVTEARAGQQQKERRIISYLEPLTTSHRLIINAAILRNDFHIAYKDVEDAKKRFYRLTYQLTRITRTRGCIAHDDRVEGLAESANHWREVLARTREEAQKQAKEDEYEKEVEKLIETRRKQGLPLHGLEKKLAGENLAGLRERQTSDLMKHFGPKKRSREDIGVIRVTKDGAEEL